MNNLFLSFTDTFNHIRATVGDTVLIIIGIVLLFLFLYFLQYKGVQIFACVALFLALIGSSIFSVIKIENYYSASGGIAGHLEDILNPNKVTTSKENIGFSFENVVFSKDSDGNYSAYFLSNDTFVLDPGEEYDVLLNGYPCLILQKSNNFLNINFSYAFYDNLENLILEDTLIIQIAFYSSGTKLIVYTKGGDEAKNLWQNYFKLNYFQLDIEKEK